MPQMRDDPPARTPAEHAADAPRMLREDPKKFLETYMAKMINTHFEADNRLNDPNVGRMIVSVISENDKALAVLGPDGRNSAVRTQSRERGQGPLQPNEFEISVVHVPVQPSNQGRFDTVHLPKQGGPDIMYTTNITACTLAIIPSKDGSLEAVHLQPMGSSGDKNGHELHDAVMNKAVPGQVVFGKRDVEITNANILGVRNADGDWKFYAQHVTRDSVVKVQEMEPKRLRRGGEAVRVDGPEVAAQLIGDALSVPKPDRLKGHEGEAKPLKPGEVVEGLVMKRDNQTTIVRDDTKQGIPKNQRPLKSFPTSGLSHAEGQEVHVGWKESRRKDAGLIMEVTPAPRQLRELTATCPNAAAHGFAEPPKAPSRGIFR